MADSLASEFPGAWERWPDVAKRYLGERVILRMVEIHGPADLLKWSYVGTLRPNGERVPFVGEGPDFWPLLLEDVAAWQRAQQARRAASSSPEVP